MTDEVSWVKWHFAKWKNDPTLRMCGLTARGLWVDLLSVMHECTPYGHLVINGRAPNAKQIASIVGMTSEKEVTACLRELIENGVCSVTDDGIIFSRRLVRDKRTREQGRSSGSGGGNPGIPRGTVPKQERVRPFRKSDAPEKVARILVKSGGNCHWCSRQLQSEVPGPDYFHVGHIVAVRDGGSNDDSNLVATCSDCKQARASVDRADNNHDLSSDTNVISIDCRKPNTPSDINVGTESDVNVGQNSDVNPEKEEEREREPPPIIPPLPFVMPEAAPRAKRGTPTTRGHRLPEDWQPRQKERDFAASKGIDWRLAAEEFGNYWRSAAGAAALKLDWDLTFRNRILELADKGRFRMSAGFSASKVSMSNPCGRPFTPMIGGL